MSLKKDEISADLRDNRYVLALSGGVDSVVLLDLLNSAGVDFVIAHADHGIRAESWWDEKFCVALAEKYDKEYYSAQLELGENASEAEARNARYVFLDNVSEKVNAAGVITAHHQGDVLETIVMNILRGTGWRGFVSLRDTGKRVRPLVQVGKQEIYNYALENNLEWVEDETNQTTDYQRNLIRKKLIPMLEGKDSRFSEKILQLRKQVEKSTDKIEELSQQLKNSVFEKEKIDRKKYIALPHVVRREIAHIIIRESEADTSRVTRNDVKRFEHFVCTGLSSKRFVLNKELELASTKTHVKVIDRGKSV